MQCALSLSPISSHQTADRSAKKQEHKSAVEITVFHRCRKFVIRKKYLPVYKSAGNLHEVTGMISSRFPG
jgi:hypothetical protein